MVCTSSIGGTETCGGENILGAVCFSLNRPSGPIHSISRFVRPSVCLYVRLSVHFWGTGQKSPRKNKFFFADFAGLFQWGGYIMTWGGYIEIWGGYITTWGGYIEIWGGYITTWGGYIEIWGGYIWCGVWGILGPPSYGIGATIRIGREMLCLPYAGFFFLNYSFYCSYFFFSFQLKICDKLVDFRVHSMFMLFCLIQSVRKEIEVN